MEINNFQVAYRDIYLDIVNQVLLMNLVARQIWLKDELARNCFMKIHNAYCALSSKDRLMEKLGEKVFLKFFSEIKYKDEYDFFSEFACKCIGLVKTDDSIFGVIPNVLKDLNTLHNNQRNNSIFNNEASRIILTYIFEKLDKDGCVSISNYMSDSEYVNLVAILSDSAVGIKETYGYSHQNIYMCLYHFDAVYKDLLINSFKERKHLADNNNFEIKYENMPTRKTGEMLIDAAAWIRLATKIYKCNFSRNTKMFSSAKFEKRMENRNNYGFSVSDNYSVNNASSLIVDFYDDKPEKILDSGSLEDFSSYCDELCEMLRVWLIDQWYTKHKNIDNARANIQKEYEKYRNDMKKDDIAESRKITKLFKSIDGSETIIYAILAFDHLDGAKMSGKLTQNNAIELVADKYNKLTDFPTAGVKKQLKDLRERIKNRDYSKIRNQQIELLRQNIKDDREFFPYPLL